jgi:hypothetical protein
MGISTALEGRSTGTPLRFVVPGTLQEITLNEDPEERTKRTLERLSSLGSTPEQCLYLTTQQEILIWQLANQGAVYAAQCVARSEADPRMLSTALFTILVKQADLQAERPLAAVAGGLKTPGQPREVVFNQYPAGEALVVGEELTVRRAVTVTGQPVANTHRVRQAQVILPFPDKQRLAIIGVASESLQDWIYYVRMLDGIARSMSFTRPATSDISTRLGALN